MADWGRDQNTDPRNMSGQQRAEFGAIVSFENAQQERLTVHTHGPAGPAIRAACELAAARDDSYRVVAVSTPATIMGDLQMRQQRTLGRYDIPVETPDKMLLTRAGVGGMMHPRYRGSV